MLFSEYVADIAQHASVKANRLLGALNFIYSPHASKQCAGHTFPSAQVCMPGTSQTNSLIELFHTDEPVSYNKIGQWQTAQSNSYFFAVHNFDDDNTTLAPHTEQLYTEVLETLANAGYQQLVRMWNYLPAINKDDNNGQERYKSFCYGRAAAFDKLYAGQQYEMPAASGVGTLARPACIALIACRHPMQAVHIENPKQTPAYAYPKIYGPRSPSFARATCLLNADSVPSTLFISGTAAIRQSESISPENSLAQLKCTVENLEGLIDHSNLSRYNVDSSLRLDAMDSIKVYYRHRHELPEITQYCESVFHAKQAISYLHADICRAELTVEIEGIIQISQ